MFQIKPDRKETENKSIRFPVELIEKIEKTIAGKNVHLLDLSYKHVNML